MTAADADTGGFMCKQRHKLDVEHIGKGTEFGVPLSAFAEFEQRCIYSAATVQ